MYSYVLVLQTVYVLRHGTYWRTVHALYLKYIVLVPGIWTPI